jgi:FAD:protein FMN transferase
MPPAVRVERAQPWLGTIVKIGTSAPDSQTANAAIDAAFRDIALVHRLMTFHEPDSEVSRINRSPTDTPIRIHTHTAEVLRIALEISQQSEGVFDVTVAPLLVSNGLLPVLDRAPDSEASWRNLAFEGTDQIILTCPLWIDLGGIAKGYAVDLAINTLLQHATCHCYVNAGGDLRMARGEPQQVLLNVPDHPPDSIPIVEVADGSVASSATPAKKGPHFDGRDKSALVPSKFAAVLAERCVIADALTKVALSASPLRETVLAQFQATALTFHPAEGWIRLGAND